MKKRGVVILATVFALVLSFPFSNLQIVSGEEIPTRGDGIDEHSRWLQFRGNLNNTGYSSSSVPSSDRTFLEFPTLWPIWSSPVSKNGIVYFGSQSKSIYAVRASTGEEIWSFETGAKIDSSPYVHNDTVFVSSSDSKLYALNATTGEELWNFTTGGEIISSPKYYDGVVFFGSKDWNFYAINISDQSHHWGAPFQTGGEIWGTPAIADSRIFFGSNDGNFYSVWIENGTMDWTFGIDPVLNGSVRYSSAAVHKGMVIVGSDDFNVYCLNESTGEKIWNFTTNDYVYSSPAVHNDTVFVGSNDLYFYAIPLYDPNGDGMIDHSEVLWKIYTQDFEGGSSPAVAEGKVLLGSTQYGLICVNETDGSYYWNFSIPGGAVSSPAVVDGRVFIGGGNGVMYGLGSSGLEYIWQFTTVLDSISPTVTDSSPTGTDVSVGTIITVTFSEPMNRTRTEGAFSTSPPVGGSFSWSGTTMIFASTSLLSNGTLYTITVGSGATDLASNSLDSSYSWQFTTTSVPDTTPPTVIDNSPTGTNVSICPIILVTFTEPMNRTATEGAFSALPTISGVTSWYRTTMMFICTSPLAYGTQYTIMVDAMATDGVGNSLSSDYSWQFTTTSTPDTTPPIVTDKSPTGTDVSSGTTITVTFSEPMDRSSTEGAFSTSPTIEGTFSWSGTTLIFTPTSPLLPGVRYTIIVDARATDVTGNRIIPPILDVEIIPEFDRIKSNRVMTITFLITHDQQPVEGAFGQIFVSIGELSQQQASTFPDGTNSVKYTAPMVQENTTVTITVIANKAGYDEGRNSHQIVVEPGTAYGDVGADSEFPWHKYVGYIGAVVALVVVNVALVVLLVKRRKTDDEEGIS